MIAYIEGEVTFKSPTHIIIEAGGIGYQVYITLNTYNKIEKSTRCKLYTHLHIKEDAHTLYGFAEEIEKEYFLHLISINGIGPALARTMLSSLQIDEIYTAVTTENVKTLEAIKGIGSKSAQRIILELKDKLLKIDAPPSLARPEHNTIKKEALSALIMLGFSKSSAEYAINEILGANKNDLKVEELIKLALKTI